ncbi:MAG: hypothetical protein IJQ67_06140 [Bacilli bacterium]|nr:hypothetical protein [Bacilli bacterium]
MNKRAILSLILVFSSLTSCRVVIKLVETNYSKTSNFDVIKKDEEGEGYYRLKEYQPLPYGLGDKTINSFRDIYSSGVAHYNAPSIGEINALVIPVNFLDSDTSNNENEKILIHNAFFGLKKMTTFESLASFYDYSSYGQLSFKGKVTDYYNSPLNAADLDSNATSSVSSKIASSALSWFYETYPDEDMKKYDKDKDGNIDALFIVYNHPSSESSESLWWAYCDHLTKNANGNDKSPYGSSYAWLSIDFLKEPHNYAETHVAIHESGHIFGLDDYYNTNPLAHFQPTGYFDMMDRNLGDHTGYSKMLLNWTTPYVADGDGTITLRPFEESGDLFLIPTSNGWNKTPYDEYLLLEFYTPTGIYKNEKGTKYRYYDRNNQPQIFAYPSEIGLKVYHVDSRVAYLESRFSRKLITIIGNKDEKEKLQGVNNYCLDFAYSNTISDNKAGSSPVLYHLLERSGENTLLDGHPFESPQLFTKGDSFGTDVFKDFVFNNGDSLTYTFTITEMNKKGVTIRFNKA